MQEYQKIQTVFQRDPDTNYKTLLEGEFARPELEYLQNNLWYFTEKVDGCLHYTNNVITNKGLLPIGRIVEKKLPVKILSYNEKLQKVEFENIKHFHREKRIRPFLSVIVRSKNKGNRFKHIVCTDNHKFYSGGKWIRADKLNKGDSISHLVEGLSYELKQIILGTLLGDSSIYSPSKTTRGFTFQHSIEQADYFNYKNELLGAIFTEGKGSRGGYRGSQEQKRGHSIVNRAISDLIIQYCEKNGEKKITTKWVSELGPVALAFWYMDDGTAHFSNKQRARAKFATNSFSEKEVNLLKKSLEIKYNIESRIGNYGKGPRLELSADGTEKLFSLIAPYVCESMKYKIHPQYRGYECVLRGRLNIIPKLIDTEVIKISDKLPVRAQKQQTYQYDLSVANNSNYFTNSILVHNTNIRVMWEGERIRFGGKTNRAQLYQGLVWALEERFPDPAAFQDKFGEAEVCLYGEGYGAKIQKGGGNYNPDGQDFVLFDVWIDGWWLERKNIEEIANKLGIDVVPIIGKGTLSDMITMVKSGFMSQWGNFPAEGVVAKPETQLFNRKGNRVITKLKQKDFTE